jgi:hypothetical protein
MKARLKEHQEKDKKVVTSSTVAVVSGRSINDFQDDIQKCATLTGNKLHLISAAVGKLKMNYGEEKENIEHHDTSEKVSEKDTSTMVEIAHQRSTPINELKKLILSPEKSDEMKKSTTLVGDFKIGDVVYNVVEPSGVWTVALGAQGTVVELADDERDLCVDFGGAKWDVYLYNISRSKTLKGDFKIGDVVYSVNEPSGLYTVALGTKGTVVRLGDTCDLCVNFGGKLWNVYMNSISPSKTLVGCDFNIGDVVYSVDEPSGLYTLALGTKGTVVKLSGDNQWDLCVDFGEGKQWNVYLNNISRTHPSTL